MNDGRRLAALAQVLARGRLRLIHLIAMAGLLLLCACGGGVGEDGTGTPVTSVGVVTAVDDTSLTVNGVSYDRSLAKTTDGLDQAQAASAVSLGMWVEVQGELDETSGKSLAQTLRLRPAVRGRITARDLQGQTFQVLGSTVHHGPATVMADTEGGADLQIGDAVEVHGLLARPAGRIEATRVAKLTSWPAVPWPYELRGRVSGLDLNAETLTVGAQPVSFGGASLELRASLRNGQVVRVAAAAAPAGAAPWVVDRLTPDVLRPDNLGFYYTEGLVDALAPGPVFDLEDLSVDARTAVGREQVQQEGQRVAVIGALRSGVLKARLVAPALPGAVQSFTLAGPVRAFVSVSDFRVRSVPIDARLARFIGCTAADLHDERRVQITGTLSGQSLRAASVECLR
jgi:Domain of unknown function (DUF5666)